MESTIRDNNSPRPIVVGIDGSDSSRAALRWAVCQAKFTHAPLEIISTWQHPTNYDRTKPLAQTIDFEAIARRALDESISVAVDSDCDCDITTKVIQGHPAPTLVDHSRSASLVVVGSRGHGKFVGMLVGSVSEFLTAHAHCPVVVVRGDDPTDK